MNTQVDVRMMDVDQIIPYENNPRYNDSAVDAVANSIREFGWQSPIVVDGDCVILAGHTRLKAAKKLGLDSVPVIVASSLTPEQCKAFRLADNKTGGMATWNFDALTLELGELVKFPEINMSSFGFNMGNFEKVGVVSQSTITPPSEVTVSTPSVATNEALPEELAGVDLSREELPKMQGDDATFTNRVIITYYPNEREALEKLLGVDTLVGRVVFTAKELLVE